MYAFPSRYIPYPGGGEKWGGNGVGDDLYSYGFDGAFLWTGESLFERKFLSRYVGYKCIHILSYGVVHARRLRVGVASCKDNANWHAMTMSSN